MAWGPNIIEIPIIEIIDNTKIDSITNDAPNTFELGDTINISDISLPSGSETTIKGRDFVIANIQSPSGLKSSEDDEEIQEDTVDEEEGEVATEPENKEES